MLTQQTILGAIIDTGGTKQFDEILDYLTDDDFTGNNKKIWQTINALVDANEPVNLIKVTQKLVDIVSAVYITELIEIAQKAGIVLGSQILKEASTLRKFTKVQKIKKLGVHLQKVNQENLQRAVKHIDLIVTEILENKRGDSLKTIEQIADQYKTEFAERCEQRRLPGVTTTYSYLNHLNNGFGKGQLIIIAGQPGMGKSAFVQNIQLRQADRGIGSVLFSLEMGDQELMHRQVSAKTGINSMKLQAGRLNSEQKDQVYSSLTQFGGMPLYIDDNPYPNVSYIKRRLKRLLASDSRIKMAIIDYLQLLDLSSGSKKSRNEMTSDATRMLKLTARELGIPIIVLSQLNRQVADSRVKIGAKVKKNRPTISHLRDSGAIEQDADQVLFVYRESAVEPNADKTEAEIIVAKCRGGQTGSVFLKWNGETTQFLEREQNGELPGIRSTESDNCADSEEYAGISAEGQATCGSVESIDVVPF